MLKKAVDGLFAQAEAELADLPAKARQAKALRSLLKHREGLSVYLDPQVPMDNNASERSLRAPIIGRKLSFGNDSWGGARLTAQLYSVLATLNRHEIDLEHWLHEWLSACAAGGCTPSDLAPWLPWSMDAARRKRFGQPRASPVSG